MRNVNDKQVVDIALEILAGKENCGLPATVSTSEVVTRFASKGVHASMLSVAFALQSNLTRTTEENNSQRWTV